MAGSRLPGSATTLADAVQVLAAGLEPVAVARRASRTRHGVTLLLFAVLGAALLVAFMLIALPVAFLVVAFLVVTLPVLKLYDVALGIGADC